MISILFVLNRITAALASESAHGGEHHGGIPASLWFQVLNFALYAGLLFFVLRKPLSQYFQTRAESFRQALVKAESARADAERQKREIEQRLAKLQGSADENLAQARAEAEELRKRILREAEELSRTLQEEAKRTADIELQRAKAELREELLAQAVQTAKSILSERIADTDQKRLQTEFVEKIQVVRQ